MTCARTFNAAVCVAFSVLAIACGGGSGGPTGQGNSSPSSTTPSQVEQPNQTATASPREITIGEGDGQEVLAGTSQQAYDEIIEASVARDTRGIGLLILSGRALAIADGTNAIILDRGFSVHKVRITSGKYEGHIAFFSAELLKARVAIKPEPSVGKEPTNSPTIVDQEPVSAQRLLKVIELTPYESQGGPGRIS